MLIFRKNFHKLSFLPKILKNLKCKLENRKLYYKLWQMK